MAYGQKEQIAVDEIQGNLSRFRTLFVICLIVLASMIGFNAYYYRPSIEFSILLFHVMVICGYCLYKNSKIFKEPIVSCLLTGYWWVVFKGYIVVLDRSAKDSDLDQLPDKSLIALSDRVMIFKDSKVQMQYKLIAE